MTNTNPFGKKGWSLDRIPDISDKTYIITGGNSGLGFETAQVLAKKGAEVAILCRSVTKAQKAVEEIRKTAGKDARISSMQMDLGDFSNIKESANHIKETFPKIDALICNAGLMMIPKRELTKDGLEMQIGVNHFGHFLFSSILFENVERAGGRFVNVSSNAHDWGLKRIKFEDIFFNKGYSPVKAYGQSKLANVLFTKELERRLRASGKISHAYVTHPGYAATNLQTTGPGMVAGFVMTITNALIAHSALHGAKSLILAATDTEAKPAILYGPTKRGDTTGAIGECKIADQGHDMDAAAKLWDISVELTQAKWPI